MSDLDRAVDARIDAYRPQRTPSFETIKARRNRRNRTRAAGATALSVLAVAGIALGVSALGGSDRLPDYVGPAAPGQDSMAPSPSPAAPTAQAPATSGPIVLQSEREPRDDRGPWEGARTDGERTVIFSFIGGPPGDGPCESEYVGSARVRFGAMAVSIDPVQKEVSPDQICPSVGYTRTLRVELPEPLDGRHVVDEQERLGPLLDGAAMLTAPAPPPGYSFSSEFAQPGAGANWTVQYTSGERAPVVLVTHTEDVGEPLEAGLIVLDRLTIRGQEALVLAQFPDTPLRIVWKERGAIIGVQNNATFGGGSGEGGLLPVEDLIAFARSLR